MLRSRLVPVLLAAAALGAAAPAPPAFAGDRASAQTTGMRKLPRARAKLYLNGLGSAVVGVRSTAGTARSNASATSS